MAASGRLLIALYTLAAASLAAAACSSVTVHPGSYLEGNLSAASKLSDGCAEFFLLPGQHIISSKLVVNISVVLKGHPNNTDFPFVRCMSNISDSSAEVVNRTEDVGFLTFWGSQSVDISRIIFLGCPLSLQFVEVTQVNIQNCHFEDFTQSPVSLYNTVQASFNSCFFLSNRAGAALVDKPLRLSAGAVSINTDTELRSNMSVNYTFSHCHFLNNTAKSNFGAVDGARGIMEGAPFNGRGGAIALLTFSSPHLLFTVNRCFFANNVAPMFGGAMYLAAPSDETSESIWIIHSHFNENSAFSGGALQFALALAVFMNRRSANESNDEMEAAVGIDSLKIIDCQFVENNASFGGGIGLLPGSRNRNSSNLFEINDCLFFRNNASVIGAAISISSEKILDVTTLKTPIVFADNVFEANDCPAGGVINTYHNSLRFTGESTLALNVGSALRMTSAVFEVDGKVLFRANDGREVGEGALHLRSYSQLRLFPNSNLEFEANMGSLGAAIVATHPRQQPFLKRVVNNTQCILLFASGKTNIQRQNISLSFTDNSAFVGAALYINNVVLCSTTPLHNLSIPNGDILKVTPFFSRNESNQLGNSSSLSDVSTPPQSISILQSNVTAYPGKSFTVNVTAVDEFGQPTAGTFSVRDDTHESEKPDVVLPSIKSTTPADTGFTMQYFAKQMDFRRTGHSLSFGIAVVANRRVKSLKLDVSRVSIPLEVMSCPPGFTATSSVQTGLFECQCNGANERILSCDALLNTVILQDRLWAIQVDASTEDLLDGLAVYPCPAGYCRCYLLTEVDGPCTQVFTNNSDLDSQCSCHRSGYLCGSCSSGTGVTALLDRCEQCSPLNGLLIAALVIVDTIVILGVMVLSLWKPLHLPSWMYPMIFYIQAASIVTRNYPRPFPVYHSPLFYLGSLLGLYFPYDFCLYPNATAVEVYAIKYIPFILASIICPSVIVAANCRGIKTNYSGVWLILMLLFNQVVYTSASVLNCPMLRDESGTLNSVWFVDGTVKCFTGGHIPLALWAIFCLLLCVAAIFTPMLLLTYRKPVDLPLRLWVLKDAVTYPFRGNLPYWYLVELTRRTLFIVMSVAVQSQSLSHAGPVILIILYFGIYVYLMPYKGRLTNILELLNLWNLLILLTVVKVPAGDSNTLPYFSINRDECDHPVPSANLQSTLLAIAYYGPLVIFLCAMLFKAALFLRAKVTCTSPAEVKKSIRRFTSSFHTGYSWRERRRTLKVSESVVELITDSNTVALMPTQVTTFAVIDEESSDSHDVQSNADEANSMSLSY